MPRIGTVVSPRNKAEYWQVVGTFPNKLYLENLADPKKPVKIVLRYVFEKYWKVKRKAIGKQMIVQTIKKDMGYV